MNQLPFRFCSITANIGGTPKTSHAPVQTELLSSYMFERFWFQRCASAKANMTIRGFCVPCRNSQTLELSVGEISGLGFMNSYGCGRKTSQLIEDRKCPLLSRPRILISCCKSREEHSLESLLCSIPPAGFTFCGAILPSSPRVSPFTPNISPHPYIIPQLPPPPPLTRTIPHQYTPQSYSSQICVGISLLRYARSDLA